LKTPKEKKEKMKRIHKYQKREKNIVDIKKSISGNTKLDM
jgi:hypothetical protein